MSFRSIVISNSANLAVKNNSMTITTDESYNVPIEDISTLVIDSIGIRLTNKLLSNLAENNVATILCNEKHLPNAIVLPINSYYKSYKVLKEQLDSSAAFRKRIWQKIIMRKLYNQGKCLELLGLNGFEYLYKLSDKVESGDKNNREAVGAKFYFTCLFGEEFKRRNSDIINAGLNYGYTIVRSAIARSLVAYGFNCTLGVNHCSELNSFNLADDFIEPFRPIVDLWVYENMRNSEEFTKEDRIKLIDLLNYECIIDGQNQSILNAIDIVIASYSTCCNKKNYELLKLPYIKKLEYHLYE